MLHFTVKTTREKAFAYMKIVLSPDERLRRACAPVEAGDKSVKKLSKQMLKEMYRCRGVGLAAPQVGVLQRIVVIDTDYDSEDENGRKLGRSPHVLVNPEIVAHSNRKVKSKEGCLSLPGIQVEVERWEWVEVEAYDADFELYSYRSGDLFGRCMQHELDHLDGVTLFEKLDPVARIAALDAYKKALAAGARPGDVE